MSTIIPEDDLRYEVKLTAPAPSYHDLVAVLRLHAAGFRVAYPPRRVNSLYFDSPELSRRNENLSGVRDRCKVRYRWYGLETHGSGGILEFKHKRGLLGWKRHYRLGEDLDLSTMAWRHVLAVLQRDLPVEVWLRTQNLTSPVLINRYLRDYFVSADGAIRLTVDREQQYFSQWATRRPNFRFAVPAPDLLVIEVKADQSLGDRVGDVLQRLPFLVSKNSKYVIGTEQIPELH